MSDTTPDATTPTPEHTGDTTSANEQFELDLPTTDMVDSQEQPDPLTDDDESDTGSQVGQPDAFDALAARLEDVSASAAANRLTPHNWAAHDYTHTGVFGSGHHKLIDSAVAPLVALARGYVSFNAEGARDGRTMKDVIRDFGLPTATSIQGRGIRDCANTGDLMLMPWYTSSAIGAADKTGDFPVRATLQWRPSNPRTVTAPSGKVRDVKYEQVGGERTVVGTHPAYSREWVSSAPTILVCEGLLKGDSALTGYLLANGVKPTDLDVLPDETREAARARLRWLLDSIDPERRILIVTILGVGNWKNNAGEWHDLSIKDATVWLGIDGDVRSKHLVWSQAQQLWDFMGKTKKAAKVHLLAPIAADTPGGDDEKVGIDDYLAHHGTWETLIASSLADRMPPRPPRNDVNRIDEFRIEPELGCELQQCEAVYDDPMDPRRATAGQWVKRAGIGGRIVSTVTGRVPSPREIATGHIETVDLKDVTDRECEIEIAWQFDEDDQPSTAIITGPDEILSYPPEQWVRHGAYIPPEVLRHPEWPPRRAVSEEWRAAMKAHRRDETTDQIRWDAMGWVPVEGTAPVFVVGNRIIGSEDIPAAAGVQLGVTNRDLDGADRFGLGPENVDGDLDDPDYRAQVRDDIEQLIQYFITNEPFQKREIASCLMAAALRPVLPLRPKGVVFLVGPPGRGKSVSAAWMMSFWAARPGSFTSNSLPGSAKDTPTAMEMAVARTPIWVIDDLAPSVSKNQAEQEQKKIGDIIRAVFNGVGKRRATSGLGSARTYNPRALVVVTAENDLVVASERDRTMTLRIADGTLAKSSDPTDRLTWLCMEDGAPARVTAALATYLRWKAKRNDAGWVAEYQNVVEMKESATNEVRAVLQAHGYRSSEINRRADVAGDMAMGLVHLGDLAEEVGCSDEILDLIAWNGGLLTDVATHMAGFHADLREQSMGQAVIAAVANTLKRGGGHILNGKHPWSVPVDSAYAPQLGWKLRTQQTADPLGPRIGVAYEDETHGWVVLLDHEDAFSIAQSVNPDLIPPGQRNRGAWDQVRSEGLVITDLLPFARGDSGERQATMRKKLNGVTYRGVPVKLETLLER